jgi:hypothetical protein
VRSMGASWAMLARGVMGDTGGRSGDADSEGLRERADVEEALLDEAGRWEVSTRSAGMTARWATSPGAEPENRRKLPIVGCHELAAHAGLGARRSGGE